MGFHANWAHPLSWFWVHIFLHPLLLLVAHLLLCLLPFFFLPVVRSSVLGLDFVNDDAAGQDEEHVLARLDFHGVAVGEPAQLLVDLGHNASASLEWD